MAKKPKMENTQFDDLIKACRKLESIRCQVNPKGCKGPWCAAKTKILAALKSLEQR